ncbi:MAG: DUF4421 domain-containing protein [Chitinophagaceae bacterium]
MTTIQLIKRRSVRPIIALIAMLSVAPALAQSSHHNHDSSYYKTYPRHLVARVFFSQKYTRQIFKARGQSPLRFAPNNPFAIGVGASYGIATLNLGLGLPGFANRDKKGKTRSLDLQSHIYGRKWVVDLYGQFYKGFYLTPQGKAAPPGEYYKRRDLRVRMVGASAYYVFNSRKFSYRAAFLQNEWQRKSAGSFLVGGEFYVGSIRGDSSIAPAVLNSEFNELGIRKVNFFEIGPGAGYAYTFVYKENWFFTASGTVNAGLAFNKEVLAAGKEKQTSVSPNFTLRGVIGYNCDKWAATVSWVENNLHSDGSHKREYRVRTGNFRVTLAKRFKAGRMLRKRLKVIDQVPI